MEYQTDVLIIGAGLAGLSAARTIEAQNRTSAGTLRYTVLEATGRIGGRVKSQIIESGAGRIKAEIGAQWLHTDLRENAQPNPLLKEAEKAGMTRIHDSMPRDFYKRGQRQSYNSKIRLVTAARKLIDDYRSPQDTDLESFFANSALGNDNALITTFGPAETGAPLNEVSVHDMRELVSCNMGEFTREPLSNLIEHLAKDVKPHIKTNSPIAEIQWKLPGREGARVLLKNGDSYYAKRIIATPSVGVLNSGDIHFTPPLPEEHQKSLSNLHMGKFNKVLLVFKKNYKIPLNANTHMDAETRSGHDIFFLAHDNGQQLVTSFLGGQSATIADQNPEAALNFAISALSEIWGKGVAAGIDRDKCIVTQWGNEPYVQGGYSRVSIGHHGARQQLAEPVGQTLYFAGEAMGATHPETGRNWATHMAGAAISGQRAAQSVMQSLSHENHMAQQPVSFASRLR